MLLYDTQNVCKGYGIKGENRNGSKGSRFIAANPSREIMDSVSREEIFSKDYLTIRDIEVLLGTTYQVAARIIRQIKFKTDRLGLQGKIHIEDYFEYYHITDRRGYFKQKEEDSDNEIEVD